MTADPTSQNLYLTSAEAAELLKLSTRTLERMRVTGEGPPFMKAGAGKRSRVLYRQSDISKWLEGNTFQSTSEYE
ncbi:MAG: helix-turn-helix domain-containing protein [Methyloligellaceae bacterium]